MKCPRRHALSPGRFSGRCRVAKGLILPRAQSLCIRRGRDVPSRSRARGMRVCILHTVAHAPLSCLSGSNPFNILFVFFIVAVCSCVNRERLSEKGKGEGGRGDNGQKESGEKGRISLVIAGRFR